ncbi:unnamed protein product [Boreogadus saida]
MNTRHPILANGHSDLESIKDVLVREIHAYYDALERESQTDTNVLQSNSPRLFILEFNHALLYSTTTTRHRNDPGVQTERREGSRRTALLSLLQQRWLRLCDLLQWKSDNRCLRRKEDPIAPESKEDPIAPESKEDPEGPGMRGQLR